MRNIWSKENRDKPCGFFFSQLLSMEGCMDEDGNSEYEEARDVFSKKERVAKATKSPADYAAWKAERCVVPEDAIGSRLGNIFPTVAIREQREFVRTDETIKLKTKYGKYERVNGKVRFINNEKLKEKGDAWHEPITKMKMKSGDDFYGCITEWGSPYLSRQGDIGVVPENLYYIIHDPYATDKDKKKITQKDSLGAAYVYERTNTFTPTKGHRIVASWIGRPDTTDGYNEQLFLMAERYNAKIFFENDRGDVIGFAKRKKKLEYLMHEPQLLNFKESIRGTHGRGYGMSMSTGSRKAEGARQLRDLFTTKISEDSLTGSIITFLNTFLCIRGLSELLFWFKDGNFDAVSALLLLPFLIGELEVYEEEPEEEDEALIDDFWNRELF
jgi:hypothetical protein